MKGLAFVKGGAGDQVFLPAGEWDPDFKPEQN